MSKEWSFVEVYRALQAAFDQLEKEKNKILEKLIGERVKIGFQSRVNRIPRSPGIEQIIGVLEEVQKGVCIRLKDVKLTTAPEKTSHSGNEEIFLLEILTIEKVD